MEKITLNEYKDIFYFIWDNNDDTIKMVNDYLKITKGENWSCGRCWDEKTNANTSDALFISKKEGTSTTNSFFYIDQYVIDYGTIFGELSKKEFDDGDAIAIWKRINIE